MNRADQLIKRRSRLLYTCYVWENNSPKLKQPVLYSRHITPHALFFGLSRDLRPIVLLYVHTKVYITQLLFSCLHAFVNNMSKLSLLKNNLIIQHHLLPITADIPVLVIDCYVEVGVNCILFERLHFFYTTLSFYILCDKHICNTTMVFHFLLTIIVIHFHSNNCI